MHESITATTREKHEAIEYLKPAQSEREELIFVFNMYEDYIFLCS